MQKLLEFIMTIPKRILILLCITVYNTPFNYLNFTIRTIFPKGKIWWKRSSKIPVLSIESTHCMQVKKNCKHVFIGKLHMHLANFELMTFPPPGFYKGRRCHFIWIRQQHTLQKHNLLLIKKIKKLTAIC